MVTHVTLILATLFLAHTNGANDNFKGVATLYGSGAATRRQALWWATFTTFAGSVASIFLADTLVRSFSGKGLVDDSLAGTAPFMLAVAVGAGLTVMAATLTGFPISTTHALTGALIGAGAVALGPSSLGWAALWAKFLKPLLISPLLAVAFGGLVYLIFRAVRLRLGVTEEWCICVGTEKRVVASDQPSHALAVSSVPLPVVEAAPEAECARRYRGAFLGFSCQRLLNGLHVISAGAVSFARGLNDTPKIVALLIAAEAVGARLSLGLVGLAMAVGGLVQSRRIAETMGRRITPMNHGQGFTANLVTSVLVIGASLLGKPVSTTHVSCGALFGMGAVTRQARWEMVAKILLAWLLTLPIAAGFAGLVAAMTLR